MIRWNHIPMIRLIIPLIAGILHAVYFPLGLEVQAGFLLVLYLILSFLLLYGYHFISFKRRWVIGLVLQSFLVLLGMKMTMLADHSLSETHFRNSSRAPALMIGRLTEPVIEKKKSYKTILECMFIQDSGPGLRCTGKLLAYLAKEDRAASLKYGDLIVFNARWQVIRPPEIPGDFDYQQYMKYHGVYDQAYISTGKWNKLDLNHGNAILSYAIGIQDRILKVLARQGLEGEEFKVASAILAGYRAALDPELQQAFSGAGAMHILCVSGLHVGVIYLVLSYILSVLGKGKRSKALRSILLITAIWLYALVTGCSPSVLRASTMISFVVMGTWLSRSRNIYNTLAASAFLLLLTDPYMIMAIGFQLSYLAVIGIVTIQPFLYKSVYLKYWLPDKAWAIITVSIAAQAGTFPLAIYYFHQFPNYFLLTNLIVIPASSLIIYIGFLLLFFSPLPWISTYISWLLSKSIYAMNASIHWINSLPGAVSDELYLGVLECMMIYLTIGFVILMIGFKRKDLIWVVLSLTIIFLISRTLWA